MLETRWEAKQVCNTFLGEGALQSPFAVRMRKKCLTKSILLINSGIK